MVGALSYSGSFGAYLSALHKPLGINKGQSPLFVPLVTFVTHESNCPRGMSANVKRSSAVKIKSNIVKLFSLPPSAFSSHLPRQREALRREQAPAYNYYISLQLPWCLRFIERKRIEQQCVDLSALSQPKTQKQPQQFESAVTVVFFYHNLR